MEKQAINAKPVYIFEEHNIAFAAWAEIKGFRDEELILLTLDHHTDVHEAFLGWSYYANNSSTVGGDPFIEKRLAQVDVRDPESVQEAVTDLRNDEQIDAAIRLGIFRLAFCLNKSTLTRDRLKSSVFWIIGNREQLFLSRRLVTKFQNGRFLKSVKYVRLIVSVCRTTMIA